MLDKQVAGDLVFEPVALRVAEPVRHLVDKRVRNPRILARGQKRDHMHDAATTSGFEAILIAGPTASGKSRLALELARAHGGAVVNADSMQVYQGLRILTARPSEHDMDGVEHRLYGHVAPTVPFSAGAFAREAAAVVADLRERGRIPVFCGGTGLYFRALLGGLSDMPVIPDEVREGLRGRFEREGPERLHADLSRRDPESGRRIRPNDGQRILRALEVVEATGRAIGSFQREAPPSILMSGRTRNIVLVPSRPVLRQRIAARFERMLDEGAAAEAVAFAAMPGAMEGGAGRAIGVAELVAFAKGEMSLGEATARAITRTRQYAKRQDTWFRNQFDASWERIDPEHPSVPSTG